MELKVEKADGAKPKAVLDVEEAVKKEKKENSMAIVWGVITSLCWGASNTINGYMASELGYKALACQFSGSIVAYLVFHTYKYTQRKPGTTYKENSAYFEETTVNEVAPEDLEGKDANSEEKVMKFNFKIFFGILRYFLIKAFLMIGVTVAYYYTFKCGINQGVISTLFATNMIFLIMYFYFVKGQKLSR